MVPGTPSVAAYNLVQKINTSGGTTVFYNFTDHLGTPDIQTNASGTVNWEAEYEPYGRVLALRASDVHQPLRLPGQVAEQFDNGVNGATGKSYNLFRWYHPTWGRYSQPDPLGMSGGIDAYASTDDEPIVFMDPFGLIVCPPLAPPNSDVNTNIDLTGGGSIEVGPAVTGTTNYSDGIPIMSPKVSGKFWVAVTLAA